MRRGSPLAACAVERHHGHIFRRYGKATDFDATAKQRIEIQPLDWLELFSFSGARVVIVDADLAAVTTDADRVIHVLDEPERLVHIEVEASRDGKHVPLRLARYNALLRYRHGLPVATVVVLLNPRAGHLGDISGYYEDQHPDIGVYATFRYRVIRIWEVPVERLLDGGCLWRSCQIWETLSHGKWSIHCETELRQAN